MGLLKGEYDFLDKGKVDGKGVLDDKRSDRDLPGR
jgi:hypothetical protein